MTSRPKLAVSSCLLGEKVRHNGESSEFRILNRVWSEHLELIGVCPEVGVGMGVPRPSIRLVKGEERISLVNPETGDDYTKKMLEYAEVQSDFLVGSGISGFVFKSDSASCGLERVKVYRGDSPQAIRDGIGLFSKVFTTLYPHIPAAEESQLRDKSQADHFLARVNLLHIWQMFGSEGWTAEKIEAFHVEQRPLMQKMAPNSNGILTGLIVQSLNNGEHPENIALNYITEAQNLLTIHTKVSNISNALESIAI